MSKFKSYRKESRIDYGTDEGIGLNQQQLQTGALLRIADAVEIAVKDRVKMEKDITYLRERNRRLSGEIDYLKRSAAAYKGLYNKLKNKQGQ